MYKSIISKLLSGDYSCITSDIIYNINQIVITLIYKEPLTQYEQEVVNDILHISNIIYNNTDKSTLVLEDGIYDLLLEKYKKYNPNYQVGAEPVIFENSSSDTIAIQNNTNESIFITPLKFMDRNMMFYNQLQKDMYQTGYIKSFNTTNDAISKRIRNTSHKYPSLVGTLDKVKFTLDSEAVSKGSYNLQNVKIFERDFLHKHVSEGIVNPYDITLVLELKYDGVSIEAEVANEVLSARTRGDTGIDKASDLTPILAGYRFPNTTGYKIEPFGMKFEAIIEQQNLLSLSYDTGRKYVNGRNAIIGILGSKDAAIYSKYITLVPLATSLTNMNRVEEIEFINKYYSTGRICQYAVVHGDYNTVLYQVHRFVQEAEYARDYLPFMYDGVVVSYLDENIRQTLGRKNNVNKYSIAIKFNTKTKRTRVRNITYTIGANGDITPMIWYDPVEFYGMINTKSSGHSYSRFMELNLKPGEVIETEYVNDVMVYINKVDCEENRYNFNNPFVFIQNCPSCGRPLTISNSGKNVICDNFECPGRIISRITNMLNKLGFVGFSEETVKLLEIKSFRDLMTISPERALKLGEVSSTNLLNSISNFKSAPNIDYNIIGALGFSGIASAKWKIIFNALSLSELISSDDFKISSILLDNRVIGISAKTVNTILKERKYFMDDLIYIYNNLSNIIYTTSNHTKGNHYKKTIRFSGIRDKELENKLILLGHDCSEGSVTNSTDILIVPFYGFTSTKTDRAKSKGITIVPLDEFKLNMNSYLNG